MKNTSCRGAKVCEKDGWAKVSFKRTNGFLRSKYRESVELNRSCRVLGSTRNVSRENIPSGLLDKTLLTVQSQHMTPLAGSAEFSGIFPKCEYP